MKISNTVAIFDERRPEDLSEVIRQRYDQRPGLLGSNASNMLFTTKR